MNSKVLRLVGIGLLGWGVWSASPALAQEPFDPFAGAGGGGPAPEDMPPAADPFGGGPAPGGPSAASDPFGGGGPDGAAPPANPFGGAATAPNPFGEAAAATTLNPFGDAAAEAAPATGDAAERLGQMYDFIYEPALLWDGRQTVIRKRYTVEEAESIRQAAIDQIRQAAQAGVLPNYDPVADPNAWAEWVFFSTQLELWSQYVDKTVLAGLGEGVDAYDNVQWPGTPAAPSAAGAEGGEEGGAATSQRRGAEVLVAANQNRSLDDQVGDFNPFSGIGGDGNANPTAFPPETIGRQVVTQYNDALNRLRGMESDQEEFMAGFIARIIERSNRRLAYKDWREDQQMLLEDYIADWNRRYNGDVVLIGGVRYELYRPGAVPASVPRDSNVVVTDFRLTPYDILTEEGRLREAARN
ncbi:hypothetical protein HZA57_00555 [Candidatus Poribacteria bacterium]|nr:hypothetical protein [Candidatus Poribacteria bacterium]